MVYIHIHRDIGDYHAIYDNNTHVYDICITHMMTYTHMYHIDGDITHITHMTMHFKQDIDLNSKYMTIYIVLYHIINAQGTRKLHFC